MCSLSYMLYYFPMNCLWFYWYQLLIQQLHILFES